jgi:hypothetical protein
MRIDINQEDFGFETVLEITKLLSKIINENLPEEAQEDLKQITAWAGSCQTNQDKLFFCKTLKKTHKKISNYFHQKDLSEMETRRNNLI